MIKEGKEGNVLFNDAPNTFHLRLYGVRHMVKDHSYNGKRNPLLFQINSKDFFLRTIPHTLLHIPRPLLHKSWRTGMNKNTSIGPRHKGSIRRPIAPRDNSLTTEIHLAPSPKKTKMLITSESFSTLGYILSLRFHRPMDVVFTSTNKQII